MWLAKMQWFVAGAVACGIVAVGVADLGARGPVAIDRAAAGTDRDPPRVADEATRPRPARGRPRRG